MNQKEEISKSAVAEEIYQSILVAQKQQRRLLSKTFWEKFGVYYRNHESIQAVRKALLSQGITTSLDDTEFGHEDKDEWIILKCEPQPPGCDTSKYLRPPEQWFREMEEKTFESENEVEIFFIIPLLNSLGYREEDIYAGYPVTMFEGVHRTKKRADMVIFNGNRRDKDAILLVIEAKTPNTKALASGDADGQAKFYAKELAAPYYLVTNASGTRLWRNRGGLHPDQELLNFLLSDLRNRWTDLCGFISKAAVIDYKAKLDG